METLHNSACHEFKINTRVANIRKNVYSLLNELLTAMLNLIVNIKFLRKGLTLNNKEQF